MQHDKHCSSIYNSNRIPYKPCLCVATNASSSSILLLCPLFFLNLFPDHYLAQIVITCNLVYSDDMSLPSKVLEQSRVWSIMSAKERKVANWTQDYWCQNGHDRDFYGILQEICALNTNGAGQENH